MVEGLDLRRRTVAYTWKRIDDFTTEHVRAVGFPSFDGEQGVHWLFTNRGEPEYFAAFAYRGQASPRTKAVAFAHDGGIAYFIDGAPGAKFEPNAQPGGTFALKADDAVAYSRRPRSWQPMRPPR
jgi:hypothetical protein